MHGAHGHAHASSGTSRDGDRRALLIALVLAASYMAVEAVGAWWLGSLALLADAGHMLSDTAALALALFAVWVASRPAGPRWTYGRLRAEVLTALAQGVALLFIATWIVREAFERWSAPTIVPGPGLLAIATGGLVVNAIALGVLAGGRHGNLSVRGAWLHVASDALGSLAAMAAGVGLWVFSWRWADPLASIAICALVVVSALKLLRDVVDVLMEAAPRHLNVEEIRSALCALEGVRGVHDLHVWSVSSSDVALSCHLVVPEDGGCTPLLQRVYRLLGSEYGITHATVQVEPADFAHETPHTLTHSA